MTGIKKTKKVVGFYKDVYKSEAIKTFKKFWGFLGKRDAEERKKYYYCIKAQISKYALYLDEKVIARKKKCFHLSKRFFKPVIVKAEYLGDDIVCLTVSRDYFLSEPVRYLLIKDKTKKWKIFKKERWCFYCNGEVSDWQHYCEECHGAGWIRDKIYLI